jgi:hypothetical protein
LKQTYAALALGVGLALSLILLVFASPAGGDEQSLPLLTSLLVCEVGFIITAIGAGLAIHQIIKKPVWSAQVWLTLGNLLLAINFARVALALWPETGGS